MNKSLSLVSIFLLSATLASAARPGTQSVVTSDIPLSSFDISAPAVGTFSRIRAFRNNGDIVLQPNPDDPANSFGWVEAPARTISAPVSEDFANTAGIQVDYTGPTLIAGTPPTVRLRVASNDFRLYGEAGVTAGQFIANPGDNSVTVHFDRNALANNTTCRLYIDLVSVLPGGTVDPNFQVRIKKVTFFSNDGASQDDFIQAAWMQMDDDIVCVHGPDFERVNLRGWVTDYCYGPKTVIILDAGNLYAYDTRDNLEKRTLADDDYPYVVQAAISGDSVIYLLSDGDAMYFNMDTLESWRLAEHVDAVGAGQNGCVLLMDHDCICEGDRLRIYDPASDDSWTLQDRPDFRRLQGTSTSHW